MNEWKLVPIEPTKEMIDAMEGATFGLWSVTKIWEAGLKATPSFLGGMTWGHGHILDELPKERTMKTITAYQTEDGKTFDTQIEAERHEARMRLEEWAKDAGLSTEGRWLNAMVNSPQKLCNILERLATKPLIEESK